MRGPATKRLGVHIDDEERLAWVRANVDTYWRGVRAHIYGELEREPDRTEFAADMVEWCVLGVARMWFTTATGGVASKGAAGAWAAERLPAHRDVIDLATAIRSRVTNGHVGRDAAVATVSLMGSIIGEVI